MGEFYGRKGAALFATGQGRPRGIISAARPRLRCPAGRGDVPSASFRPRLSAVNPGPIQGFALGEKNPIGKSFAVRSPAGASRITGIEFTATDAVAMSP